MNRSTRRPLRANMLFNAKQASVSPSWVRFEETSFSVRSITRLSFKKIQAPRVARYSLFFVSLALLYFSGLHVTQDTLPYWLAMPLLIASALLMGTVLWLAVIRRPYYQVRITLFDGTNATSKWRKEALAQELHDAITRAMDWHRANSGGGDADIIQNVAARRKSANAWSRIA